MPTAEYVWWERRRTDERTHEYLARVLVELRAYNLADKALGCHYDDFLCPDEVDDGNNIHRLCSDLYAWSLNNHGEDSPVFVRAMAVRLSAMRGEFDSTNAESRAWAKTLDGKRAYRDLAQSILDHKLPDPE